MKLGQLQRYFAMVATSKAGPPADLNEVFKDSPALTANALLAIYNRGYHYRLLGALSAVFPRTKSALGDAEFERRGLQYLARHPSEHPAIERVGRLFPDFLAELPASSRELGDLATLEWARLTALVAPDPDSLTVAHDIDAVNFPRSRLHFVPSLTTRSLDARALALFAGTAQTKVVVGEGREPGSGAPRRGVAVWRKRHRVLHEALDAVELEALELARAGASVSHFCALFDSGAPAADAERAFRAVSGWFAREWIERTELVLP